MSTTQRKISDAAVRKATGKGWNAWFALLDSEGADALPHKQVAQMLHEKGYIASGWWCQMVTVEYERARGKRVLGGTEKAGFQIGVQKTLPLTAEDAWNLITQPEGLALWLGTVSDLRWEKRAAYETAEGTRGEIRSFTPGKLVRLTWQPPGFSAPSTLQVYLTPSGDKTALQFHQEKLASAEVREQMRAHWRQVLQKLAELVEAR
ncbi:MAG: SRPBCC domain-containing protein [Chloroflexota bacterium]|nr:SRPBCC domain-containing protein [Chloroflexota bacterium]MDE2841651.1 SRPBCC domain-containing protein [Chloroflexota bacterium]MDE2931151.1 SRPBCC domain-containing protein [Chloroflexota bacterium]